MSNVRGILTSLSSGKTDNLFIQFVRYTIVGGLAFVVDFGLLFLLSEYCGIHYILSATISFVAGLVINYIISTLWVFDRAKSKVQSKRLEFLCFTAIGIVGLGLNDFLIYILTDYMNFFYMISKAITAIVVYLWNFLARKYFIFNKK